MTRLTLIGKSLVPTLVMWLVLVIVAVWRDGHWPTTDDQWATFLLLGLIVEFLLTKATLMATRMREWVWLTASLIAANVAFASVYLLAMLGLLWPRWYGAHLEAIRWSTRIGLAVVLLWGWWQLVNAPPPAALDTEER